MQAEVLRHRLVKFIWVPLIIALASAPFSCGPGQEEATLNTFIVYADGARQTMSVIDVNIGMSDSGIRGLAVEAENDDFSIVLVIFNTDKVVSFPATVPVLGMALAMNAVSLSATVNWTHLTGGEGGGGIYSNPKPPGTGSVTLTGWDATGRVLRGELSTMQVAIDGVTTVNLTGVFSVELAENPFVPAP